MAAAAPQLLIPGVQRSVVTSSSVNEEQLVNNVVTSLQPSIAQAVANALRSLQLSSVSTSSSFNSGASSSGSQFGSSRVGGSSSGSSAAVEETGNAQYNYEFKVADNEEQTYISQQESRNGDQLTGTYSYVDANGALVTVNYEAGPMGFQQTTDKQEGFVEIRPQPVRATSASSSAVSSSSGSSSSNSNRFSGNSFQQQSSSSSIDQSALIAQIVAALQPQITSSVNSALAAQQNSLTTTRVVSAPVTTTRVIAAPLPVAPAAATGNLASVFGDGYNVRIATPEFNVEY